MENSTVEQSKVKQIRVDCSERGQSQMNGLDHVQEQDQLQKHLNDMIDFQYLSF